MQLTGLQLTERLFLGATVLVSQGRAASDRTSDLLLSVAPQQRIVLFDDEHVVADGHDIGDDGSTESFTRVEWKRRLVAVPPVVAARRADDHIPKILRRKLFRLLAFSVVFQVVISPLTYWLYARYIVTEHLRQGRPVSGWLWVLLLGYLLGPFAFGRSPRLDTGTGAGGVPRLGSDSSRGW